MTGPTVGTCSLCKGPVKLPTLMLDPIPTCATCGATAENPYGPVMAMKASPPKRELTQADVQSLLREMNQGL